jgi:RNA polymerase sigma-70 factor (family 1)
LQPFGGVYCLFVTFIPTKTPTTSIVREFGRYGDEFTLMRSFTTGEKFAFTSVYNEYYFRVYEFASKYLPTQEDAEDITADSFTKLWQKRNEFASLEHIRAFLFTTAKNACLNFLQHSKIKDEKHTDILRSLKTLQRDNFLLEEIRAELMQLVYAEVDKLPAKMKEIFLLSYKEGLKPAEIAERLQISVQTVSNQKLNAINLLKTALGNTPLLLALLLCLEFPQNWTA